MLRGIGLDRCGNACIGSINQQAGSGISMHFSLTSSKSTTCSFFATPLHMSTATVTWSTRNARHSHIPGVLIVSISIPMPGSAGTAATEIYRMMKNGISSEATALNTRQRIPL